MATSSGVVYASASAGPFLQVKRLLLAGSCFISPAMMRRSALRGILGGEPVRLAFLAGSLQSACHAMEHEAAQLVGRGEAEPIDVVSARQPDRGQHLLKGQRVTGIRPRQLRDALGERRGRTGSIHAPEPADHQLDDQARATDHQIGQPPGISGMHSAGDRSARAAPRRVRSRSRDEHQPTMAPLKAINDQRGKMRQENINDVTEARRS